MVKLKDIILVSMVAIPLVISSTTSKTDIKYRIIEKTEGREYSFILEEINHKKSELSKRYENAGLEEKIKIEEEARDYIFEIITKDLFNQWYGTVWNYNGTTKLPKKGTVACGYFVSTILKDAGFNINRIKLAMQSPEYVIKNLEPENMYIFKNIPNPELIKKIKEFGTGLYILGLDSHVGFIVYKDDKINFVHSSYYYPFSVVSESLDRSLAINDSNSKLIGKILDKNDIQKWITNERIEIKYDYFKK